MKRYLPLIQACPLFAKSDADAVLRMLSCLGAQLAAFQKGNIILHQGDPARTFGVVLQGSVKVLRGDMHGTHSLLTVISEGDLFGETIACASVDTMPFNVVAAADSLILLLDHKRVITGCSSGCIAHSQLITALLRNIADKNLMLTEKMEILAQRTTRAKLLAYLQSQQKNTNSATFSIPLDRQGLADFLNVERSAMSTELNKLKKEGLIDFHKNIFRLYLNDGHKNDPNE